MIVLIVLLVCPPLAILTVVVVVPIIALAVVIPAVVAVIALPVFLVALAWICVMVTTGSLIPEGEAKPDPAEVFTVLGAR